jgi:hypothetical protein
VPSGFEPKLLKWLVQKARRSSRSAVCVLQPVGNLGITSNPAHRAPGNKNCGEPTN